jgi:hypothetical protein
MIHIPPFSDYGRKSYTSRQSLDYVTVFGFFKMYILVRLMKEKSPLNSNSGRFIGSFTNIEFSDLFFAKTWLKGNPFQAMSFAISTLLVICGYMIFLSERKYPIDCSRTSGKFSTFYSSLYLIMVTVFTVGYGDITP